MWRQAATRASWVAFSAAASGSRRISRATTKSRPIETRGQLCKRVMIARHRPLHEIPVHRASRNVRGLDGRATPSLSRLPIGWFPIGSGAAGAKT